MLIDCRQLNRSARPVSENNGAILLNDKNIPIHWRGTIYHDWRNAATPFQSICYDNTDAILAGGALFRTVTSIDTSTNKYGVGITNFIIERYYIKPPHDTNVHLLKVKVRKGLTVTNYVNILTVSMLREMGVLPRVTTPTLKWCFDVASTRCTPQTLDDLILDGYSQIIFTESFYTIKPVEYDLLRLSTRLMQLGTITDDSQWMDAFLYIVYTLPCACINSVLDPVTLSHAIDSSIPARDIRFHVTNPLITASPSRDLLQTNTQDVLLYNHPLFSEILQEIEALPYTDFRVSGICASQEGFTVSPMLKVDHAFNRYSFLDGTGAYIQDTAFPQQILQRAAEIFFNSTYKGEVVFPQMLITIERTYEEEVVISFVSQDKKISQAFYYDILSMDVLSFGLCNAAMVESVRDENNWL